MFKKISEKITKRLIAEEIINDEDKELYHYGIEQGTILLVNILSSVILGLALGCLDIVILFFLYFIPLRTFCGGIHSKSALMCYIYSMLSLFVICSLIKSGVYSTYFFVFSALLSAIAIDRLSPVEDPNKPLDETEQMVYKEKSRLIWLIEGIISVVFLALSVKNVCAAAAYSFSAVTVMMILGKIKIIFLHKKAAADSLK